MENTFQYTYVPKIGEIVEFIADPSLKIRVSRVTDDKYLFKGEILEDYKGFGQSYSKGPSFYSWFVHKFRLAQ